MRAVASDIVGFRLWPPLAIGVPLVVGGATTWLWGDPVALGAWRSVVGWVLVAAFAGWNGWALILFRRHRTGLLPGQPTQTLMEEGPFALSRNPLYVGLAVLYVGAGLLLPSVWVLLLTPVAVLLLDWGAIGPEERFLAHRFGSDYDAYARRVRRWL